MNQLFISIFDRLFKSILPSGTLAVVAGKAVTFVAVMVVVSCITKIIMNSNLKMILGGR